MTNFGIALATAALQVSLAAVVAASLVAWAGRRSPRTAAGLAGAALGLCSLLVLAAVVPLPDWWRWDPAPIAEPVPPPTAGVPESAPAAVPPGGVILSIQRLTGLLPTAVSAAPLGKSRRDVWTTVAAIFLLGTGFELGRLIWAVAAVAAVKRRSRAVTEAELTQDVDDLRRTLGVGGSVPVRESAAIGTAATIGWLRPLILLAEDWRTWQPAERRAVLAHELAHVRRRDYLVGLFVLIGRAAHFYHPLVRWLAGRVRLHQELAADALAASVSGGRKDYLRALARMALLQDAALAAGAVRPFLSDRGSLLRRVAMLRVTDDGRPLGRSTKCGMVGLLVGATFAVSAVRGPAQPPASEQPADGQLPPLELSYISQNAAGLIAIRPAVLLNRPEMKPIVAEWQQLFRSACKTAGLGPKFDIPFDAIEQIVGPLELKTLSEQERKLNPNGANHAVVMGLSVIRMTREFDWPAVLKAASPLATVTEVKPGVFECRSLLLGPEKLTAQVVDSRTLAFSLTPGQVPSRHAENAAHWGAALKAVEGAVLVEAVDNGDGRWSKTLADDPAGAKAIAALGRPTQFALGIFDGASVGAKFAADYEEEMTDADIKRRSETLRRLLLDNLPTPSERTGKAENALLDLAEQTFRSFVAHRSGRLVTAEAGSTTKWLDLLRAVTPGPDGGLEPKVEVRETKPQKR